MDKTTLIHKRCTIAFELVVLVSLMVFALAASYSIIDKTDGDHYKAATTVIGKYRDSDGKWVIVSKPMGVMNKTEWTVNAATYWSYDKGDNVIFWTSFSVLHGTYMLKIACVFVLLLTSIIIILAGFRCLFLLCDLE